MKHNFCWILNLSKRVVHGIPVILSKYLIKDKLQRVTNPLRSLLYLYVRSKCSKRNDTLRFADKN